MSERVVSTEQDYFIDEETLRTDIPDDEVLLPTDGSIVVRRDGVRMQVRKIDGEQRIEV